MRRCYAVSLLLPLALGLAALAGHALQAAPEDQPAQVAQPQPGLRAFNASGNSVEVRPLSYCEELDSSKIRDIYAAQQGAEAAGTVQ